MFFTPHWCEISCSCGVKSHQKCLFTPYWSKAWEHNNNHELLITLNTLLNNLIHVNLNKYNMKYRIWKVNLSLKIQLNTVCLFIQLFSLCSIIKTRSLSQAYLHDTIVVYHCYSVWRMQFCVSDTILVQDSMVNVEKRLLHFLAFHFQIHAGVYGRSEKASRLVLILEWRSQ